MIPGSANPLLLGQTDSGYEIERSLRFNSGDSSRLTRTFSAGNRKVFTISLWAKKSQIGSTYEDLFGCDVGGQFRFIWEPNGNLEVYSQNGSTTTFHIDTVALFRDPSAWYHFVVSVDATNTSVKFYVNGVELTDFVVHTAVQNLDTMVNSAALHTIGSKGVGQYLNAYLADVHFIDGQALAATDFGETNTNNLWVPKAFAAEPEQVQSSPTTYVSSSSVTDPTNAFDGSSGTEATYSGVNSWISFTVDDASRLAVPFEIRNDSSATAQTVAMFTDSSGSSAAGGSWASTANNNLSPATSTTVLDTYTFPSTGTYYLRHTAGSSNNIFAYKIGGPITTGGIGANGFHLDFADNSSNAALGTDTSGNSNTWTVNNLSAAAGAGNDSLRDTPTNGTASTGGDPGGVTVGNYATLNPLHKGLYASLTNGNLDCVSSSAWGTTISTIGVSTGKWYAELTLSGTIGLPAFGVSSLDRAYTGSYLGQQADSYCWFAYSGSGLYTAGAYTNQTGDWVANCAVGDVIGLALDMDNGTLKFYKNGNLVGGGNAFTGITGTQFFATCSSGHTESWNFGQRAFSNSSVPSGYKALCTANLPDPTIADGSLYFDTKLWTGNGSTQSITGYNFSPDFAWIKQRNSSSQWHWLTDVVRGVKETIFSNDTYQENTEAGGLSAFNADGYSLGNGSGVNATSGSYVGWAWDGGDSNTTIAVGGLNSSVYDQSQTWSSSSGIGSAANSFDGSLSTGGSVSSSGSAITITTSTFTASSISFYKNGNNDSNLTTITVNGTAYTFPLQSTATGWVTVNLGSEVTVTSLTSTWYGGYTLYAVKADNKLLVDSGVSVPNVPSIASTVRANPSAGFSIVGWDANGSTNQTIGHGLNAAPEMMIIKNRTRASNWTVFHKSATTTTESVFYLNTSGAVASFSGGNSTWWNAFPTSSVFSVGATGTAINHTSGDDMIAYCFAPVEGYSAMGSYVGNGSTDGSFVSTNFRPKWILLKNITSAYNWYLFDTVRSTFNVVDDALLPNSSSAEATDADYSIDILSNGFKLRNSNVRSNASSNTYIYIAFAEYPFQTNGGLAR